MTRFAAPIAEQIWDMKYRHKMADGTPLDATVEDTWRRIAKSLAAAEKPELRDKYEAEFYRALEDFKFIPAGRIVSGAGTGRNVTLFNCFVMGTIPDAMGGIFEMLKEAALTMQQGGGIGYDFSTLRPKGALVKGVAADASGPLSFMDVWDSMCRTIMSAGSRRGAMMATMRCDHPDILDFIKAKRDSAKLRMFNLSVLVTDDFMAAVKKDGDWNLVHKANPGKRKCARFKTEDGPVYVYATVKARDLWNEIMRGTYECAEPGVIFIDRINNMNPLRYIEKIASTNPCGEQPLPPYGACLLGSINLARLVKNPFESDATIDSMALKHLVHTAVRMMDNVIDVTNFPLPQQAEEALNKRRIGLGITGLADMLLMLGVTYGSKAAVMLTERVTRTIAYHAYLASAALAKEKGAFPLFDAGEYLSHPYLQQFFDRDDDEPDNLKSTIAAHGLRNSHLTSIAPTGTISLYAGNVSSGIEPVFAYHYKRKVLQKDGTKTEERVEDYALNLFYQLDEKRRGEELPDHFVSAQTLTPEAHVRMQAAAQKWVDSSISKTINCPEDISFDDFKAVYEMAYDLGCKGCTTYRPNDVTGSVLSVDPAPEKKEMTLDDLKALTNGWLDVPDQQAWRERAEGLKKWLSERGYGKVVDVKPEHWKDLLDFQSSFPVADFSAGLLDSVEHRPGAENWADTHARIGGVLAQRDEALPGMTYKIKWPGSEHAIYVTINDDTAGRPFEIFINSKDTEHFAWTVALTRMISGVFRRGGDVGFVADELKAVFDPRGGAWIKGKYIPSVLAAIGEVIEKHLSNKRQTIYIGGVVKEEPRPPLFGEYAQASVRAERPVGKPCPKCSSYNTKSESGCFQCLDCGDSKCG